MRIVAAAALLIFSSLPVLAADYYVSAGGSDANSGSQSAPFKTIQHGVALAKAGDTVHVLPYVYPEEVTISASGTAAAPITLVSDTKGGAKVAPTVSGAGQPFWAAGDYITISGFDIDGSNYAGTVGVYMSGSHDTAIGNHVHNIAQNIACNSHGGGGIVTDNWYGGVFDDVNANVVHDIGPAGCSYVQGIYISTSGNVENNLVYAISSVAFHLWHNATHVNIINNTEFGSGTGLLVGSGDCYPTGTSCVDDYTNVANNVFYDNSYNGIEEEYDGGSGGSIGSHNTYMANLVSGNANADFALLNSTASGSIMASPAFVNYVKSGGGDYHLAAGSPAIGKGVASNAPVVDLDGVVRPSATGYDIGAYQYAGAVAIKILKIGAAVQTTAAVNVRVKPGGRKRCVQPLGAIGAITSGPTNGSWDVAFTSGCSGWVSQSYLKPL